MFRNSTLYDSKFVDTDIFPYRFENCDIDETTTFDSMDAFCPLEFDYNIHLGEVFLEQIVGEVALIPGLILAAIFMDRFGRVRLIGKQKNSNKITEMILRVTVCCYGILGISFLICSLLIITLAAVRSHEAVIGVEAAFNFVFAVGLVSLIVSSTETCPTSIRYASTKTLNIKI